MMTSRGYEREDGRLPGMGAVGCVEFGSKLEMGSRISNAFYPFSVFFMTIQAIQTRTTTYKVQKEAEDDGIL